MDLVKDEYYRVEERGKKDKYLIFKFNGTYYEDGTKDRPNYYYSYSNMNSHWGRDHVAFMRPDGSNSYPCEFRLAGDEKKGYLQSFVSIHNREVKPATPKEILLLEACRESNMTITIEEFRNTVLNEILG